MADAVDRSVALPCDEHSPAQARRFVREVLTEGNGLRVLDEALLLTTELTTNAVLHAGTDLEVSVKIEPDAVLIRVADQMPGLVTTERRDSDDLGEGGRGLYLVDALAETWGTTHTAYGKTVWFTLVPEARRSAPPRSAPRYDPGATTPPLELGRLIGVSSALAAQLDQTELMRELLARVAEATGAAAGRIVLAEDEDGDHDVAAAWGLPAELRDEPLVRVAWRRLPAVLAGDPDDRWRSQLAVPITLDGSVFGAVELASDESGRFGDDQAAVAQLAADRVALVVQSVRLREAERQRSGWLTFIAEASEFLAGSLDVELTLNLVPQLVVPRLAEWCAVHTFDERGEPRLAALTHEDEGFLEDTRKFLAAGGGEITPHVRHALATGLVSPLPADTGALADRVRGWRPGAAVVVPLTARRRTLGTLTLVRVSGAPYTADERAIVEDVGRRAALAVDNARLYSERTAVAQALQKTLLPPTLPEAGELDFGARYDAAGEGNEVGGDFYDVFQLPGGSWMVAMGDVCGKGAEAAAVTGLARDVIRLLSQEGKPLPEVLERLNAAVLAQGEHGRFCTVAAARIDSVDGRIRVSLCSAGHPLPVLVPASGDPSFVGKAGTLVGVLDELTLQQTTVDLAHGDALVFYTDGITERRSGPTMFGDENLFAVLRGTAGRSADQIAARLQEAARSFATEPSRDDLAVLVVRRP